MATRVGAVRALAAMLVGLAVLVGVVLLAGPAGPPGATPAAPGTVAARGRPSSGTAGGPPATSAPGASAASATPPPALGSAADPCRLVTRAEAAAALGRPVARVQARRGYLVRSCLFSSAQGGQVIVQLHLGPAASRTQFRMGRRPDDQPVAGVGDEAWFTPDTGLLDVRGGTGRFQVGLLDATGRPAQRRVPPGLLTLARAIAGRLR